MADQSNSSGGLKGRPVATQAYAMSVRMIIPYEVLSPSTVSPSSDDAVTIEEWPLPEVCRIPFPTPLDLKPGVVFVAPPMPPCLIWSELGEGGTARVLTAVAIPDACRAGALDRVYEEEAPTETGIYQFLSADAIESLQARGVRPALFAIKVLSLPGADAQTLAHAGARLVEEVKLLERLQGKPSFPQLLGHGTIPLSFVAMEYVRGWPSHEVIADPARVLAFGFEPVDDGATKRLPWTFIYAFMTKLVAAVAQLHAAGIVHRDLKPDNVLLIPTRDGGFEICILDFGTGKDLSPAGDGGLTTAYGLAGLTLPYAAYEQAIGGEITLRTDVVALGRIFAEMCEGSQVLAHLTRCGDLEEFLQAVRVELPDCTHSELPGVPKFYAAELWREMTVVTAKERPGLEEVQLRLALIQQQVWAAVQKRR